jgi:Integrase core domain
MRKSEREAVIAHHEAGHAVIARKLGCTSRIARMEGLSSQPHRRHRVGGLFVVPPISFRLLYGFLILQHRRRMTLWIGVTAHPNAEWIARQLTEAYAWVQAPQYIIRDRDRVYGDLLIRRLRAMGIRVRPIAPRKPWQNEHTERLIGSIRRECTFASCWDRTKGITMTRARTYR